MGPRKEYGRVPAHKQSSCGCCVGLTAEGAKDFREAWKDARDFMGLEGGVQAVPGHGP